MGDLIVRPQADGGLHLAVHVARIERRREAFFGIVVRVGMAAPIRP